MNKTLLGRLLAMTVILLSLSACTTNNGDIGHLFGVWNLVSLTNDGNDVELATGDVEVYSFSFQSDVVCVRANLTHHDTERAWGSWAWDDEGHIVLDFKNHDDGDFANYDPMPILGLNYQDVSILDVEHYSSSRLTLSFINNDGHRMVYNLKKTYH